MGNIASVSQEGTAYLIRQHTKPARSGNGLGKHW